MTTTEQTKQKKRNFYTVDEFYNLLDGCVSKTSIYYQIKNNKIPFKKFGEKPLLPAAYVESFLNG